MKSSQQSWRIACIASIVAAAAGPAVAQGGPSDAQIAGIVVAANQVDIDAGTFAESRASSKDVKAFAHQMVTDHSAVNRSAVELVTRLKVKPEDSETAQGL